ncbi:CopG family transcriptional regulator [Natrialba chahannaoensis JCM 10990]|uniref:CopG family transcriptional regulator n=1 Tax=Natrialba chahannaoensis JCM 10990 TaxID=1227492 RepID=M0AEF0_9EURY|nr:zinc ribbon domain-containing protein [Natrialba chahannaoensis]ELY96909.1 CopG family transcriptional regulator [Natrialba chahannaoensis JCM 10990]
MSKITFRADDDLVEELESLELSKSEAMRQALRSYLGYDEAECKTSDEAHAERAATSSPTNEKTNIGSQLECLLENLVCERVDERLDERLESHTDESSARRTGPVGTLSDTVHRGDSRVQTQPPARDPQDVNVTISLAGVADGVTEQSRTDQEQALNAQTRETRRTSNPRTSNQSDSGQSDQTGRAAVGQDRSPDTRNNERPQTNTQPASTETKHTCDQCGETVDSDHVYCPNCGEKSSRRLFCECGDEYRSDWSFCPGCGRRTPAADVLEPR